MLPTMAISLIRDFYGAMVHEMEQHHSGAVVNIPIHLVSTPVQPPLLNDVIIELRTAIYEREVVRSVWSGISLI